MEMQLTACGLVDLDRLGTRMKIIFVRHGEPDYCELEERSYTGFGIDLAPLSEKGRQQAQELSTNPLLFQLNNHIFCSHKSFRNGFLCGLCYGTSFESGAIIT